MLNSTVGRKIARTVAFAGVLGVSAIGGHGVAEAYPPQPPSGEIPDGGTPDSGTPRSSTPDSSTPGTLPQTGGPGTTEILVLASAALAGGVAVTGFAGRNRRRDSAA